MITGKRRLVKAGSNTHGYAERECDGCQADLTPRLDGDRVRMPRHLVLQFSWQGSIVAATGKAEDATLRTIHLCTACARPDKLSVAREMIIGA